MKRLLSWKPQPFVSTSHLSNHTRLKSSEVQQVTERVEQIKVGCMTCGTVIHLTSNKNDASIPVRGNKKAGTLSKKEVREQVNDSLCPSSSWGSPSCRCKPKLPTS